MDDNDQQLKAQLRTTMRELDLQPFDDVHKAFPSPPSLRRGLGPSPTDNIELMSLVRGPDGVLRWEVGMSAIQATTGGRRAGAAGPPGRVVDQFFFEKLAPNQIGQALDKLDKTLTPYRGLRRWNAVCKQLEDFPGGLSGKERVLLLIHGTFSNSDKLIGDLLGPPEEHSVLATASATAPATTSAAGATTGDFLAAAAAHYDLVLTFDHPTVAVSPAMNAFDLAAGLGRLPAELDVVAHSRGGLVARWFLEGFAGALPNARAILVGSTVAGTSLAAPPRIKSAFNLLANVGSVLGNLAAATPHPFIVASGAMLKVVSSLVKFGTALPALDAAVAMVPGLQGQSRVGNNPELVRLRANYRGGRIVYSAVRSDFQPRSPGWNFLKYFSKPLQRFENWAAELVFDGPNDLVVDVESMNDLAGAPSPEERVKDGHLLDFGENEHVHHTNYFRQGRTLRFIRQQLNF